MTTNTVDATATARTIAPGSRIVRNGEYGTVVGEYDVDGRGAARTLVRLDDQPGTIPVHTASLTVVAPAGRPVLRSHVRMNGQVIAVFASERQGDAFQIAFEAAHMAWLDSPEGAARTAELGRAREAVMARAHRAGVRVSTAHLPRD